MKYLNKIYINLIKPAAPPLEYFSVWRSPCSVSKIKKEIKKYFNFTVISVQLDKIQIGVINVVNKTKYKDIPSIPMWKWQKFKLLNSSTN